MKTLKKQNGLTMWGWLVILTMIGYIAAQAFSLITPAINYTTVQSVLNKAADDPILKGAKPKAVAAAISKKTQFNGVDNFDVTDKDTFQVKKTKKGLEVKVNYQQKADFFGPLGLLLTLEHEILIGGS